MGYIYKITNKINGNVYVGQTIRSIYTRWSQHKNEAYKENKKHYPLYRAIRKYGCENFNVELIEEVDNALLDEREIFWISNYDSYKNGYNQNIGGSSPNKIDCNKVYELWDDGKSIHEICIECNISNISAKEILKPYKNYSKKESRRRRDMQYYKPVAQYDLDGSFIAWYPSIQCASENVSIFPISITNACKGKQKTSGGYQWRYAKDEKSADKNIGSVKAGRECKMVNQYDFNNNYIQTFESAGQAAKFAGVSTDAIRLACNGKTKSSAGYLWAWAG